MHSTQILASSEAQSPSRRVSQPWKDGRRDERSPLLKGKEMRPYILLPHRIRRTFCG